MAIKEESHNLAMRCFNTEPTLVITFVHLSPFFIMIVISQLLKKQRSKSLLNIDIWNLPNWILWYFWNCLSHLCMYAYIDLISLWLTHWAWLTWMSSINGLYYYTDTWNTTQIFGYASYMVSCKKYPVDLQPWMHSLNKHGYCNLLNI